MDVGVGVDMDMESLGLSFLCMFVMVSPYRALCAQRIPTREVL